MENNYILENLDLTYDGFINLLTELKYEEEIEQAELTVASFSSIDNVAQQLRYIFENNYEILNIKLLPSILQITTTDRSIFIPIKIGKVITDLLKQKYTYDTPMNSMLVDVNNRFSGATWFENMTKQTVVVAGVGGIGSYVAFLLSRLKVRKIIAFDDDSVEATNLSGQLYSQNYIGYPKVDAMQRIVELFNLEVSYTGIAEKITQDTELLPIILCGFDNMKARKTTYGIWKNIVSNMANPEEALFIDGRLAAEELQIISIQGNDTYAMEQYEQEWLFSDEEADATTCSYKQTTYMANMIASLMVNVFVNFVDNMNKDNFIERELPFIIKYRADLMTLNYE